MNAEDKKCKDVKDRICKSMIFKKEIIISKY